MLDLEGLKNRFTPRAQKVLEGAVEESKNRQHYYLGVEHLFLSFARNESIFFMEVMEDLKVDGREVLNFLNQHLSAP
ncbi:MAG: Clp protease N-terminal domain-containing protein, partial [Thermodesulfobacteriota bacterium]